MSLLSFVGVHGRSSTGKSLRNANHEILISVFIALHYMHIFSGPGIDGRQFLHIGSVVSPVGQILGLVPGRNRSSFQNLMLMMLCVQIVNDRIRNRLYFIDQRFYRKGLVSRSLLSVSSCGICGKTELSYLEFSGERFSDPQRVDVELIPSLFDKMETTQHGFSASGGSHAASAFTLDGELLCTMEDIGRHNAVDKVVGDLILSDRFHKAKIMTVSGRLSYEIAIKCFKAQIPFLAAVSAPSSLAVDYAKELGITLFAFCRKNRITCYAHPERVPGAVAVHQST